VLERLLDMFVRHEGQSLADAIAGLLAEVPAVA
jgi:hypothetical protein